jgi:hypothetical protein
MDKDTSINFNSTRNPVLEIALSTCERLQNALNSDKHEIINSIVNRPPLTIRELLYRDIADMKTVMIDYNITRYLVLFKWYSLFTLRLKEVFESMEKTGDVLMRLSRVKLKLYVITAAEIATSLSCYSKDVIVTFYGNSATSAKSDYVVLSKCQPDILIRIVRKTALDCSVSKWKVTGEMDTIFTIFRGNKFSNVVPYSNITFSTNVNVTAAYTSRVNALILYNRYITCANKELQLANIFCSNNNKYNTYSSIARSLFTTPDSICTSTEFV